MRSNSQSSGRTFVFLSILTLALTGVSGCGQKGPLYIPQDQPDSLPAGSEATDIDAGTDPATPPLPADQPQADTSF